MSQEKKKTAASGEPQPAVAEEAAPTTPAVEAPPAAEETQPKPTKAKTATAKEEISLTLVGAGSYASMTLNIGTVRKGRPFTVDADTAEALLQTGFFEKV